jgi:hypothetical protein
MFVAAFEEHASSILWTNPDRPLRACDGSCHIGKKALFVQEFLATLSSGAIAALSATDN